MNILTTVEFSSGVEAFKRKGMFRTPFLSNATLLILNHLNDFKEFVQNDAREKYVPVSGSLYLLKLYTL